MNLRNSLSARSRWPAINILLYNFPERKRKKNPFCLLKVSTRLEVFKAATMRCRLGLRFRRIQNLLLFASPLSARFGEQQTL